MLGMSQQYLLFISPAAVVRRRLLRFFHAWQMYGKLTLIVSLYKKIDTLRAQLLEKPQDKNIELKPCPFNPS